MVASCQPLVQPGNFMLEVEVDFKSRSLFVFLRQRQLECIRTQTTRFEPSRRPVTIGELATLSNLRPSAIRFYEKTGLLPAPTRKNGRRTYSLEAADRLTLIGFAKETGFSLPEIKLLLHGFSPATTAGDRWRKLAASKIQQLEASIAKARAMEEMLRKIMKCRCATIDQCARGLAACLKKGSG
jgi:MerR family transcriptional regulator, redox-sensitive transcriptional activator SoxR